MQKLYSKILVFIFLLAITAEVTQVKAIPATDTTDPGLYSFVVPEAFGDVSISAVATDSRGIAYFGSVGGVFEFDSIEWRFIPTIAGIETEAMTTTDRGRIYVAGNQKLGYLMVDNTGATIFMEIKGAYEGDAVVNMFSKDNYVYLITRNHILQINQQSHHVRRVETGKRAISGVLWNQHIFIVDLQDGIFFTPLDQLFAVSSAGISFMQPDQVRMVRARKLEPVNSREMFVLTASRGVQKLVQEGDINSLRLIDWSNEEHQFFLSNHVSSMSLFREKFFAFGSYGGGILVMHPDGRLIRKLDNSSGLANNVVLDLLFTSRGRLWAVLPGSVALINMPDISGDSVQGEENDFFSHTRSATVQEDDTDKANLADATSEVMAETNGLRSRLKKWYRSWSPRYRHITPLDFTGVDPEDFTTILRSVTETKGDSLIFRGAFSRDRAGIQALAQSDSLIHLFPFELNAFRFTYATNQFENADQIVHQVWLEGLDRDWSNWSPNTYREYTNLRFGAYQFRVRSMNAQGEVSVESAFRFQILPPWHQAVWFYFIQLLMIISMLMISFYLNKKGKAFGVAQFLIYLVIVVTFEYILVYSQPIFFNITKGIAFFEIGLSVLLVILLTPVESAYKWFLYKATGLNEKDLLKLYEKNKAEKNALKLEKGKLSMKERYKQFFSDIASKGRLNRN
ncbi:MAG: hypothetical protein LAT67_11745 [Balneolales bacterium]|nr:hypothetical protein [Balneolales bacterium]